MENQYIINESTLIDLLTTYHYINWLNKINKRNGLTIEERMLNKSFKDLAKSKLKYYQKWRFDNE